uniref:Synaptopodin 2 like n=1 Tax=Crocodylus porosus TaxID=8502 RepID=A0A7M4E4U5_CROPO
MTCQNSVSSPPPKIIAHLCSGEWPLGRSCDELHRHESMQEKTVKEAKTKCRTIASLLTDAPNPHSKGVLMFKKRRQRAKKYTLVSFGSVDEDRCYEEEDGVFPTSESEFDEEGFSDARSLTNHSDWDNTYLDIEKPKSESEQQEQAQKGLSEASGKGARLFEQQRQRAGKYTVEHVPVQKRESHQPPPAAQSLQRIPLSTPAEFQPPPPAAVGGEGAQPSPSSTGIFNRSARPFTPGFLGQCPMTSSVIFRPPAPRKSRDGLGGQSSAAPPFSPASPGAALPAPVSHSGPVSSLTSLYIPAPSRPTTLLGPQQAGGNVPETKPPTNAARTSSTSIFLSTPSNSSLPRQPYPAASPAIPRPASEPLAFREQRVATPAPRTGILQEARWRGNKKPMFSSVEEKKKNSPNPELLSLVQNLDEKPKGDAPGAGFESGPEEDFLSLGAEACNFMQPTGRKFKTTPPVAPKPHQQGARLVNGAHDMLQLKGKGAELFAKRQSRMDKFVVETAKPESKPRTPSPTPSLPSSWKYSPNIRAPPPIAYNPMHSPFYPLAASKSQASKAESKVKKVPSQKSGIKAIDFMRHQPYQLKSAMFCFGEPTSPGTQNTPMQTGRTYEIRRFSTPAPIPTSGSLAPTVLTPRSATTLDEPVWRTETTSSPYQSFPDLSQVGQGAFPKLASSSGFQVARPKFSAARTGMQPNVWRPRSEHH